MTKPTNKTYYSVGYGKPPAEHRFKKGQSGNRRGRPRKTKKKAEQLRFRDGALDSLLEQEAFRSLQLNENGKPIKLSAAQAIFRSLIVEGLKGNRLGKKYAFEMLRQEEDDRLRRAAEHYSYYAQKKAEGEAEIARCEAQGVPPPRRFPHPHDILVDEVNVQIHILGPLSEDQAIPHERGALVRDWFHACSVLEDKTGNVKLFEFEGNSASCSCVLAMLIDNALPPSFRRDDHATVSFLMELQFLTKRQLMRRMKDLIEQIADMPQTIEERLAAREHGANAVSVIGDCLEKAAAALADGLESEG